MFKKDDYIIDIRDNRCYKLGHTSSAGLGFYQSYGYRTAYFAGVVYYTDRYTKWRYATDSEKQEYDRLGGPYILDINNKESLVGRYIKVISKGNADYYGGNIGDILKILSEDDKSYTYEKYGKAIKPISNKFELLPIDYNPENKEIIQESKFIVGKWYKNLKHPNYICKLKSLEDQKFLSSEYIYDNNIKIGGWFNINDGYKEVALEEIQQYLPEEHIDKIYVQSKFKSIILDDTPQVYRDLLIRGEKIHSKILDPIIEQPLIIKNNKTKSKLFTINN